jgi:uncharacterized alkaline shock family protein YloU
MADTADPVGKTPETRSYDEHRSETEHPLPLANVHIAPEVLLTIARLSASRVSGVSRLCSVPGGVNRLFKKNFVQGDGLCIETSDEAVFIDIYVALKHDVVVRDVCREIQYEVQRAITEMVGLKVGRVNIHVEDIDYPEETKG